MRIFGIVLLIVLLTAICPAQELTVMVKNQTELNRPSETIEIPFSSLGQAFISADSGSLAVFEGGRQLVSQWIGSVGQGMLIFQSSFTPGEEKTFTVRKGERIAGETITQAKYILPRKDVTWENDVIGHRIYGGPLAGDVRDGIDVWVKRVPYPVMDKWYHGDSLKGKARVSYHVDHGEGADYFSVGKTLGAGGCGFLSGGAVQHFGFFRSYQILASGPIRAMFKVTYDSAFVNGEVVTMTKIFTLDAGSPFTRIDVGISPAAGDNELVIGVVKRPKLVQNESRESGWLSVWGPVDTNAAHGEMGTGVVIPGRRIKGFTEDSTHYYAICQPAGENPFTYFAGDVWTLGSVCKSREEWLVYLDAFTRRLDAPLSISENVVNK